MVLQRENRQRALEALREHLERPEGTPFAPSDANHPADLAEVLATDFGDEEVHRLFREMPRELAAEILAEADDSLRELLLEGLSTADVGDLVSRVSNDDGADILELLPEEERQAVLEQLEPQDARELRHLGEYPPETAGGLMTTDFVAARADEKVGDVLKRIKQDRGEAETVYAVYILDDRGVLEGVVSTRELLEAGIHEAVGDIMNPDVIRARVDEDQEEVAHRILHYNLSAIPVLDARGTLLGIVTGDDALEVLEEEGSEDALLLAGAGGSAEISEPLPRKALRRAPMLVVNILGGLVISRLMQWFLPATDPGSATGDWEKVVPYLPMVLGLAGNVGNQTTAILVRGYAVGQVVVGRRLQALLGEVRVGLVLGLAFGLLAAMAGLLFSGDLNHGAGLGLALAVAMSWTSVVAGAIVVGSDTMGLDPALMGPVITAVSDLSATTVFFFTFLGFSQLAP